MGLHTGKATLGGDNYVGLDVHRAARVAAAGHGGQVLVSGATQPLRREPGARHGFTDLGQHRLKDLSRPEHLWQLTIEGLPADFPPLRTLDATPNNLPLQLTSFLGRRREVAEVLELLADQPLVTLTGPGGTGKTRLALRSPPRPPTCSPTACTSWPSNPSPTPRSHPDGRPADGPVRPGVGLRAAAG